MIFRLNMDATRKILITCLICLVSFSFSISQNTSDIDSIIELGNDLVNLNDFEAAEQRYDQALEMNPNYPPAIEAKINVLIAQNKTSKAEKMIEEAVSNHPNHAPFYIAYSEIMIQKERFEEALQNLDKSLRLTEKSTQPKLLSKIYVDRGAVYQKMERYNEALEEYSKALEINNQNPNVFAYRGFLYYRQDRYKKAIADFRNVLDLDANNHYALYNIGMSHFKLGNKLDACDAFHRACELGNKNACKMVISKCLRGAD